MMSDVCECVVLKSSGVFADCVRFASLSFIKFFSLEVLIAETYLLRTVIMTYLKNTTPLIKSNDRT